jgi:hypothetical protein
VPGEGRDTIGTRTHHRQTSNSVPMFLDQLLDELRYGPSADFDIARTATHSRPARAGMHRVSGHACYGDVCRAVTELAVERQAAISTEGFRTLNRCLDVAGAVTEYGRERDRSGERGDTFRRPAAWGSDS